MFRIFVAIAFSAALMAQPSPGSLYVPGGRFAASTRDLRASEVGDIVTILVKDNASAVATGATNSSRKSSANSNIAALAGPTGARLANLLGVTGAQQLQGQGQTSRNMTLTTNISARVTEVTANGTLMVEGLKDVSVNSEKQSIVVRGAVRPADLTTANTVASDQVANLSIQINGKGVVGDAIRRPHFLYRLILGLLPF
ncbi:MAG: flagellar basal body L-ring protein FlgH [Bryobacterales bacterium]|nr:flagellar basal body L-ring protein FlgH [Bryobacterales bacterium]MBV9400138.1 flagellar basal body L-ring protein FlgH [Bryobacterales bacterium]